MEEQTKNQPLEEEIENSENVVQGGDEERVASEEEAQEAIETIEKEKESIAGPFKIVGLITSLVTVLACFVGAVMWISVNMVDNRLSIEGLESNQRKLEKLVVNNHAIISQHEKLLVILEQHKSSLRILTNFMTKGGRFTEADGREMNSRIFKVEDRIHKYDILATELSWIKKTMNDMEKDIKNGFNRLDMAIQRQGSHTHKNNQEFGR